MLNILQKNNIINVLIVVTRYFGGILLGTGGLVRSYTEALQKALENSEQVRKCQGIEMIIELDYNEYRKFKNYCKENNIFISNVEYSDLVVCKIELEEEKKLKLREDFETKTIIRVSSAFNLFYTTITNLNTSFTIKMIINNYSTSSLREIRCQHHQLLYPS